MDDTARLGFGGIAERYVHGRPGYPAEAAAWLVQDAERVLELGAGTGKFTSVLAERHAGQLLATDPDERMLHHLQRQLPDTATVVAAAERIPAASRSVDVVVAAQAGHWFDLDLAIPEVARVLRPYGVLALVWNDRDEQVPWVRKLGRAIGGPRQESDPMVMLEGFDQVVEIEQQTFRHWQNLDRQALLDMVASRSNVVAMSEEEREACLAEVSALYDDYGRGVDGMQLPYVTRCYRIALRDLAPLPDPQPGARQPARGVADQAVPPEEVGEPTVAMDRADLPFSPRPRREDGPGEHTPLIDLR